MGSVARPSRRRRDQLGRPRRAQAEPAFFARLVELSARAPAEVAYVGDRVDNDVLPALEAGLVAVHVRRGPWGLLQPTPDGVPTIDSLSELGPVLDRLASDPR